MTAITLRKLTGILFITGALLVNIPFNLLIVNFEYPDILREPTGYILTQFQAGGTGLIFTWLAFAWVGLPLFFAIILLRQIMAEEKIPYLWSATIAGVIGAIAQMIGLLRWVFVVPILAQLYTAPTSSEATKDAVVVVFQVVHQYGGVVLGEHIGQMFTIIWMFLVSIAMLKSTMFRPWLGWSGIFVSAVYVLAQTELLATVIPNFFVAPEAGLIGSILWLVWMIALGVYLLRMKTPLAAR